MSIGELNLDLRIEECSSCKNLVVRDDSYYLDDPVNPIVTITIPGYSTAKVIEFDHSKVNIFNSYSLGLSASANTDSLIVLPDGLYKIVYAICPYDEIYKTFYHMRQCQAWCDYDTNLRALIDNCYDLDPVIAKKLQHAEWLLKGASAYAKACETDKAVAVHRKAIELLDEISCQLS